VGALSAGTTDIKPANILVAELGAKILDFGLANMAPAGGALNLSAMPTISGLGTAHSTGRCDWHRHVHVPEQVRDEDLDARTTS
jgi:serine/threonine protein kinase